MQEERGTLVSYHRAHSCLLALLLGLTLLLAGCSSGSGSSPTAQATTAPTATIALPPTATLPPTVTPLPTVGKGPLACTAPATLPFPLGDYYPADAQGNLDQTGTQGPMTLKADGSFNRAGTLGCFAIIQQQIIFTDDVQSFNACLLYSQVGAYIWNYAGRLLSLTLVNDPCAVRNIPLTKFKWKIA